MTLGGKESRGYAQAGVRRRQEAVASTEPQEGALSASVFPTVGLKVLPNGGDQGEITYPSQVYPREAGAGKVCEMGLIYCGNAFLWENDHTCM